MFTYIVYIYTCSSAFFTVYAFSTFITAVVHDLIIHEMLRKKERQSNTTQLAQGSYFSKKKLPRVGFEPMTVRLLGVVLTN